MPYTRTTATPVKVAINKLHNLIELIDIYSDASLGESRELAISKIEEIEEFARNHNVDRFVTKSGKIIIQEIVITNDEFINSVLEKITDGPFAFVILMFRRGINDLINKFGTKDEPVDTTIMSRIMYGFKDVNDMVTEESSYMYRSVRDYLWTHSDHAVKGIWEYRFRYILNGNENRKLNLTPYYTDTLVNLFDEATNALRAIGLIEE